MMSLMVVVSACMQSPTPTVEELPPLPTPAVPPIPEIDAAITRWQNSKTTRYFAEVEERHQDAHFKIRLVVADGVIRAAQRLDYTSAGGWSEPVSLPPEQVSEYMIESILQRIRKDALGQGEFPVNMQASFDKSLGFPIAVHTDALPAYNDRGELVLNRAYGYDLTVQVKALLEDTYGAGKTLIYSHIRSGGENAWCDNLRIFDDGEAIYTDDCRNKFLQLPVPQSRFDLLNQLRAGFASLDDLYTNENATERLIIIGSGQGSPDPATLEAAWAYAQEVHPLISETIGLGLTMVYLYKGELIGFDVFNKKTLPSQLAVSGELRSALLSPDGKALVFSDENGLSYMEIDSQTVEQLLPRLDEGYYQPRAWSADGSLIIARLSDTDAESFELGWTTVDQAVWQPLPTPEGTSDYGCDTGLNWSPTGSLLAITGLGYGAPCNLAPGLTVIDLSAGTARRIIAPEVQTGVEGGGLVLAGAHTPAWSPDGSWIAFGLDQDASAPLTFPTRLYRVHPDGSNLTPLTNNSSGVAAHPVWAPDGNLYYSLSGAGAEVDGIYRYSSSDNTHTLLIPGSRLNPLSISPDGEFLLYETGNGFRIWQFRLNEDIAEITGEDDRLPAFVGWFLMRE